MTKIRHSDSAYIVISNHDLDGHEPQPSGPLPPMPEPPQPPKPDSPPDARWSGMMFHVIVVNRMEEGYDSKVSGFVKGSEHAELRLVDAEPGFGPVEVRVCVTAPAGFGVFQRGRRFRLTLEPED